MSKKKKDKKPKEKKFKSGVEERIKKVAVTQAPEDADVFKMENEKSVDMFMRKRTFLGSGKIGKSIKETSRIKHKGMRPPTKKKRR